MIFPLKPTALDAQYLFKGYGVLLGTAGVALYVFGDAWLAPHLSCDTATGIIVARLFGAVLAAAGCASAAVGVAENPEVQRIGAGWFAWGHAMVYIALFSLLVFDRTAQVKPLVSGWPGNLVMAMIVVFFIFWRYRDGEPVPSPAIQSLLRGEVENGRLRSRYEEQLRLAAGQEERHRLARDLHDSVKQQLFVIQTAAATAQTRFDGDSQGAREAIAQVRDAAREAIVEMQAMLDQLRAAPLENTGLVEAIKKQCEALGFRTGAKVQFELGDLPPNESLAPGTQEAMLRATQEALANIARHARAKNVSVKLSASAGQWVLLIRDDGSGFDTGGSSGGMGISNMRARAKEFGGIFEMESAPGQGATIRLALPYREVEAASARHYGIMAVFSTLGTIMILVVMFVLQGSGISSGFMLGMLSVACARNVFGYLRTRSKGKK